MNFIEAISFLKRGDLIRRRSWSTNSRIPYLKLTDKDYVFNKPYEITRFSEYFSINDIEGCDWEIFEKEDI
jgi:hypothetical protein